MKQMLDRHRRCCWPIGEPRTPDYRTCGAPQKASSSYCAGHHAIAYRAVPISFGRRPKTRRQAAERDNKETNVAVVTAP